MDRVDTRTDSGATGELWRYIQDIKPTGTGVRRLPPASELSKRWGLSGSWAGVTLRTWERRGRIEVLRDGRAVVGLRIKEQAPSNPADSLRERLLKRLKEGANAKGAVVESAESLRRALGLSAHDLTKALYDLKALGILTFREEQAGTQKHVIGIQLRETPELRTRAGSAPEKPAPVSVTYRCSKCVEGGLRPSEAEYESAAALKAHKEKVHPDVVLPAPTPVAPINGHVSPSAFPNMLAVVRQHAARQRAMIALKEAGEEKAIVVVNASLQNMTPIEKEIIRMAEVLGWK